MRAQSTHTQVSNINDVVENLQQLYSSLDSRFEDLRQLIINQNLVNSYTVNELDSRTAALNRNTLALDLNTEARNHNISSQNISANVSNNETGFGPERIISEQNDSSNVNSSPVEEVAEQINNLNTENESFSQPMEFPETNSGYDESRYENSDEFTLKYLPFFNVDYEDDEKFTPRNAQIPAEEKTDSETVMPGSNSNVSNLIDSRPTAPSNPLIESTIPTNSLVESLAQTVRREPLVPLSNQEVVENQTSSQQVQTYPPTFHRYKR